MDALIAGYCQYGITFIVLGVAIILIALDVHYSRLDHRKPKPVTPCPEQHLFAWQYATMFQTAWCVAHFGGPAVDLDFLKSEVRQIRWEVKTAFASQPTTESFIEACIINRTIEWCGKLLESIR